MPYPSISIVIYTTIAKMAPQPCILFLLFLLPPGHAKKMWPEPEGLREVSVSVLSQGQTDCDMRIYSYKLSQKEVGSGKWMASRWNGGSHQGGSTPARDGRRRLQGSERKTAVVQDQFLLVGASHGWVDAAKRDGNASCL